jgi:hypothetical protein
MYLMMQRTSPTGQKFVSGGCSVLKDNASRRDVYRVLIFRNDRRLPNWRRAGDRSIHIVAGRVELLSRRELVWRVGDGWIDSLSSVDVAEAKGDLILFLPHW